MAPKNRGNLGHFRGIFKLKAESLKRKAQACELQSLCVEDKLLPFGFQLTANSGQLYSDKFRNLSFRLKAESLKRKAQVCELQHLCVEIAFSYLGILFTANSRTALF
jgi:hypothetical protein